MRDAYLYLGHSTKGRGLELLLTDDDDATLVFKAVFEDFDGLEPRLVAIISGTLLERFTAITSNAELKTDWQALAERIYLAYPRHVAKPPALRAITKALKEFGLDYLMSRTQTYAAAVAKWSEDDKRFIPMPATWFNQKRFQDDDSTWVRNPVTANWNSKPAWKQQPNHEKGF